MSDHEASASPSSRPSSPTYESNVPKGTEQSVQNSSSTQDGKVDGEDDNSPEPGSSSSANPPAAVGVPSAGDWQAIWSPAHNAYYFYNATTQETTWANPLEQVPPESTGTTSATTSTTQEDGPTGSVPPPAIAQLYAMQAAAAAQGIDPSLAFLDPSLAAGPSTGQSSAAYAYTAKFNARTGAFARPDARDPTHLSEYERMKRMNEVFFDQSQWEEQLAKEKEEAESKKRKKPTKKDLERFKEQKRLKKIAKTAWLRT
ncbi:hypothetical protein BDW22DRAFT_1357684 [Trametopsis cervina]|nr:hypothetical protein BDW22DRAFT_1357684 [Trametopsis cervina]